jgi:hypothetical protein
VTVRATMECKGRWSDMQRYISFGITGRKSAEEVAIVAAQAVGVVVISRWTVHFRISKMRSGYTLRFETP